jgi:ABC-type Na+ efflux pump permease subunit
MHPRAIWAIARKDALDLIRNRSTLGGLLFPLILSFVWLIISRAVGRSTTDILVYNPGDSNVVQVVVTAAFGPAGATTMAAPSPTPSRPSIS